ncbi:MAG TPA: DUF2470 domain-containing protein [Candidatus Thalassarchaeaceae archaeon]|nr:MAG TPA: DUF2470 domain-containing protein [Candidatus Poseidoniales archaeon]HII48420.1 DUF2470 domain-containing protein [Candidatus Thalassarchaeaceae archaeon]
MSEKSGDIPRHAPPKGASTRQQELLYDPNVATSSHAEQARTLIERVGTATLCTISHSHEGHPYGSFVTFAMDGEHPIFLISRLAEHTKNLLHNSKTSLLVAEGGDGNPLALGRVTLVGICEQVSDDERPRLKEIFVQRHPDSKFYVDFGDFLFFRLKVDSVRYIGGFGRMSWFGDVDWAKAEPDPLYSSADGIIEHMNDDHQDAMLLICHTMSKATDATEPVMTGVDRYGFEMSVMTGDGRRPIRVAFENTCDDPDDVRSAMVNLVKIARSKV